MAAPVQKGTALYIGWGGYTHASYVTDDIEITTGAEVEVIKGADNETLTKIISDPFDLLRCVFIIKSAGSLVPPIIGATFTLNSVNYMVEDASVKPSRTIAKLTVTIKKEGSMTYS